MPVFAKDAENWEGETPVSVPQQMEKAMGSYFGGIFPVKKIQERLNLPLHLAQLVGDFGIADIFLRNSGLFS